MYRSNNFDGDVAASRNIACGGDFSAQGSAVIGHNLKVRGWLEAPNVVGPCKGLFDTAESLAQACPAPEPGSWALVGDALPAAVYAARDGRWEPTGGQGGTVDLRLAGLQGDIARLNDAVNNIGPQQMAQTLSELGPNLVSSSVEGMYVLDGSVFQYPGQNRDGYADCPVRGGTQIEWIAYEEISFSNNVNHYFCFYDREGRDVSPRVANNGGERWIPGMERVGERRYRIAVPAAAVLFRFNYCLTDDYYCCEVRSGGATAMIPWLEIDSSRVAGLAAAARDAADGPQSWTCARRLRDITGKRVLVFGDSIAAGVASPGLQYLGAEGFLGLFCSEKGAICDNRAVSGAKVCEPDKSYSVCNTVQACNAQADIVIVAAGVNDWAGNVPLGQYGDTDQGTFYGALRSICQRLRSRWAAADVVFITPIPCTAGEDGHAAPLDAYRQAIYEVATANGCGVVSGLGLGMPRSRGAWAAQLIDNGDTLHPTALGHRHMAAALAGILL